MKIGIFTRIDQKNIRRLKKEAKRLNLSMSDLIDMAIRETLPYIEESKGLHLGRGKNGRR
jgi:antitoxin component of RelBE/YafQ-DinJ toxin-antitoxin module